ncbi:MAG: BamA/TamA family outer membrane protein [Sulfurovum sp.]|nr:BamA/TamA family outer membrane protein [Sulfurovum sp.]
MLKIFKLLLLITLSTFLFAEEPKEEEKEEIVLPTHTISFSGQEYFESSDLEKALGVDTVSFFLFWKDDTPKIKDKLLPTLKESVIAFYHSEGFYDVEVSIKENKTSVDVEIKENKPVRITSIEVKSDYELKNLILFEKGEIFRAKPFSATKTRIVAEMFKEGYCSYDLVSKAYVDLEKHSVDLKYTLKKGGICTFGKLTITGLETVDEDVVISRVRALEGERFSTELVQDTSNNLYALGAFDSVLINVDKKFYNVIPVDIAFTEISKPYHLEAGAGFDTYVGARVHGEITKFNFLGDAQKLKLKASWSSREQLLVLSYLKPALFSLFDYSIDLGARVGYSNLEYDGFQEAKAFTRGYLQHEDGRVSLKTGIAFENIGITKVDNLPDIDKAEQNLNEGDFVLAYPYVNFVYDARDSKLNPKNGFYLSAYAEFGGSYEEDASAYLKTLFEARIIHTFSKLTLSAVGKVGVVDDDSENGLPESKYFFAGGIFSNRAYGFREIGVIISPTHDTINGASSWLNLSVEANYPVWGDLYGAVFTDNTMLTDEAYDYSGEIISTAGLGVRYMTPLGPFKFDVGLNVQDPSVYAISFQIGQSF